ncbi:MAG: NimC/NimA family protein [Firmicutes bacterium]|nr:NimC/NimA family protein [Bacillota bacterium]
MKEVQEFLKSAGVYYLATVDNNKPKVRPFGTAEIFEDHLYIQTGKSKDVYKQILNNPYVELSAFKDGKWIRVEGKLISDDRVEAKKDMLDKNPSLRGMYNENDDNTIVLYFESGKATIYSFTEEAKVIEF